MFIFLLLWITLPSKHPLTMAKFLSMLYFDRKYWTYWDSFNKKGYTFESHHQQFHCVISSNFTCLQWRRYIWFTQPNMLLQLVGRGRDIGLLLKTLTPGRDHPNHSLEVPTSSIMHDGVLAWSALMSHKNHSCPKEYTADTYNHSEKPHPASPFNSFCVLWD